MAETLEIRPLTEADDRSVFSCGQADLDRFFQDYAGQNQFRYHVCVTYVATVRERIVGFATVATGSIERSVMPSARLRRRLPSYPLPMLRLARLGVDVHGHGAGVGAALLRHVLRLALEQRDALGCVGVVVDAKEEAVSFYESFGFVPLDGVREGWLHAEPTPMLLPIGSIESATSA